jgi:hypothetical protein
MVNGTLQLQTASSDPPVLLQPLRSGTKIQWNREAKRPKHATHHELQAYADLGLQLALRGLAYRRFQVTGPLIKTGQTSTLFVRKFKTAQKS